MGCVSSKQLEMQAKEVAWDAPLKRSPLHQFSRSFSLPLRHSKPPEQENSHFHVVALTSSTYGALKMETIKENVDAVTEVSIRVKPQPQLKSSSVPQLKSSSVPSVISSGNEHPTKSEVRSATEVPLSEVPDVIDVGKLMEDLEEDDGLGLKQGSRKNKKVYGRSFSSSPARKTRKVDGIAHNTVDSSRIVPADKMDSLKCMGGPKEGFNIGGDSVAKMFHTQSVKGLFYGASLFPRSVADSYESVREEKANCEVAEFAPSLNGQSKTETDGHSTSDYPSAIDADSLRFDPEILNSVERAVLNQLKDDDCSFMNISGEANMHRELETSVMAKCLFPEPEDEHLSGTVVRKNKIPMAFEVLNKALSNKKLSSKVSDIEIEEKKLILNGLDRFEMRCPPGGEDRVVFYFTSLRGIRKTYEDCNNMRITLQGFKIKIDERDVSMHSGFRKELNELLEKPSPVPRLFIRGRYIGGVEEFLQLNEDGLLSKLLEGFPIVMSGKTCEGCGGARFIPCPNCSGSRKVISEMNEVVRCPECNENGLVRCPICC